MAVSVKVGVISRCMPTIVKVCTMAEFGTELPAAGAIPESMSSWGVLTLPQSAVAVMLGPLSDVLLDPQPTAARPHNATSPTRPAAPWLISRVSESLPSRSIQNGPLPTAAGGRTGSGSAGRPEPPGCELG